MPTTVTYNYTGNVQYFTMPSGVGSIQFDIRGAQGGTCDWDNQALGGFGGRITGTLNAASGTQIAIYVGNRGTGYGGTKRWYGGGAGLGSGDAAGGGGLSGIAIGTYDTGSPYWYAIAGGGGGAAAMSVPYSDRANGGHGGGINGSGGELRGSANSGGGGGGTRTAAGFGGDYLQGGSNIHSYFGPNDPDYRCGGGGGGLYGGGCGHAYYGGCAAGGGGSGYQHGDVTGVSTYLGWQGGEGQVYITYNRAPSTGSAPTTASPARGTQTISWGAGSDPDNDSINYHVEVYDGANWSRIYDGGATSMSYNFANIGATQNAHLRVLVTDSTSTWASNGWQQWGPFTVNRLPSAPTALSTTYPASGTQTVTWSGAGSGDSGQAISYYNFEYYNGTSWTGAINVGNVTSYSYNFGNQPATNNAHMRVQTVDSFGEGSGWFQVGPFTVNRVPGTPGAFTSPTVGQVVPGAITVTWGAASDADNNVNNYELEFYTGSAWAAISTANNTSRSVDLSTRAATNAAKFRVRAYDTLGGVSGWTESPTFTVNRGSTAPTLNTPAANAVDGSFKGGGTFTWTFNDPDAGATQSAYAFRRTSNGVNRWWTGSAWSATETFVTSATSSVTFGAGLWPAGSYTWSVATRDNLGGTSSTSPYATARVLIVPGGLNMIL